MSAGKELGHCAGGTYRKPHVTGHQSQRCEAAAARLPGADPYHLGVAMTQKNNVNIFNSKVQITPGCWIWLGSKDPCGYGRFKGPAGESAHRNSYFYFIGEIPHGMQICHRCDNPECVNPDHLFAGSNQDNVDDKISKGRHPRGEKSATAKINFKTVSEIRSRYIKGSKNYGTRGLARIYGISHRVIWSIVANKARLSD